MTNLLFDLDGTLLDSETPIRLSLDAALGEFGLDPATPAELRSCIGPPLLTSLTSLLESRHLDSETAPDLLTAYRRTYRDVSIRHALLYPGIREMLTEVGERHRMGVVTSKPKQFAEPIIETLGLHPMLEVVEGPEMGETEEKAVTLRRALERLSAHPWEAVLIGDRHFDITAGSIVGTGTGGVTWGFGSRSELEEAGAGLIFENPAEVTNWARHIG